MKDRDDRLGDNRPAGPRVLSGITKAHLAELVFDCYGVRIRHIRKVYSHIKGLPAIVGELIEDEFLREVEGMHYPGDEMLRLVSARDGSSIADLRKGVEHAIFENHYRPVGKRFRHTDLANDVLIPLKRKGFQVCGESRMVLDLPLAPRVPSDRQRTQIKPDGFVYAVSPFGARYHALEVERSRIRPTDISDKLEPWELAIANGYDLAGIVVLENRAVEERYISQIGDLPLLTSTIEDVNTGPLRGEFTVLRYRGEPARFEIS